MMIKLIGWVTNTDTISQSLKSIYLSNKNLYKHAIIFKTLFSKGKYHHYLVIQSNSKLSP